ncbi:MAG: hypothetical protein AB7F19_02295 [Candidatus Babeliales bacterium]
MKFAIAFLGLYILASSTSSAMDIQELHECRLPSAEDLKKRLQKFKPLIENTDLIASVAGKKLVDCNVPWAVDLAICDYLAHLKKQQHNNTEVKLHFEQLESQRPMLICLLLQDAPEAIAILKRAHVFKRRKVNYH